MRVVSAVLRQKFLFSRLGKRVKKVKSIKEFITYEKLAEIPKPFFKAKKGLSVLEKSCYSFLVKKHKIKGNLLEKACRLEKVKY